MTGKSVARIVALVAGLSIIAYPWMVSFDLVESSALPLTVWIVIGFLAVLANVSGAKQ